jgi:hypothetical protein
MMRLQAGAMADRDQRRAGQALLEQPIERLLVFLGQ